MKMPMHGSDLQYKPFEFDHSSTEEIAAFLVKQNEMMQMKGIAKTIRHFEWMDDSTNVLCNVITGRSKYYGNMVTPYHNHTFYEVNYVLSGELVQNVEGKTYVMKEGDLLFLPPQVYHVNFPRGDSFCVNVLFKQEFIAETSLIISKHLHSNYLKSMTKNPVYLMFSTGEFPEIKAIIEELFDLCYHGKAKKIRLGTPLIDNIGTQLLLRLADCERLDHMYTPGTGSESVKERTDRILKYIRNNYATVTIEDMSKIFGYSPQHIRRLVMQATGKNFKFYVVDCKLKKADHLVRNTNYPIKDIAAMVGFTPEYFSRKYKYERGYSPEQCRKLFQSKKKREIEY